MKICFLFGLYLIVSVASDVILKPIKQGRNTAGIIFLPGAEIAPEQYLPLFRQVQLTSSNSLWISIASFIGTIFQ